MTNFREVGALIGFETAGATEPSVIYWHEPVGRTAGALPDDTTLWDRIWAHRANLLGFAHTHPGGGAPPAPSHEDLTTFIAIEHALGECLYWWIINETHAVYCTRDVTAAPTQPTRYTVTVAAPQPWMDELWRRSNI